MWIDIFEALYAKGLIEKIYYQLGTSASANSSDETTLIDKSKDPKALFIIKDLFLSCGSYQVTFQFENFATLDTISFPDGAFNFGFNLRPLDENLVVKVANSAATPQAYTLYLIYYKIPGGIWDKIVSSQIEGIVKKFKAGTE